MEKCLRIFNTYEAFVQFFQWNTDRPKRKEGGRFSWLLLTACLTLICSNESISWRFKPTFYLRISINTCSKQSLFFSSFLKVSWWQRRRFFSCSHKKFRNINKMEIFFGHSIRFSNTWVNPRGLDWLCAPLYSNSPSTWELETLLAPF